MSFHSFTVGAQGVTTISDAPEPVASALAQANSSSSLDFRPPQATTPRVNLRTNTKLLFIAR